MHDGRLTNHVHTCGHYSYMGSKYLLLLIMGGSTYHSFGAGLGNTVNSARINTPSINNDLVLKVGNVEIALIFPYNTCHVLSILFKKYLSNRVALFVNDMFI